jgi:hypothetical protein
MGDSTSDVKGKLETTLQTPCNDSDRLKTKLRSLLSKHDGCTKHPDVIATVNELAGLPDAIQNCSESPLFRGTFVALSSPNFPGRLKSDDGEVKYTLGRLSFNIFKPHKLVCTLRSVQNPVVEQVNEAKKGQKTFSYSFILDVLIHTLDGDLPAIIVMEGYCYANEKINNRMNVTFSGGTLLPTDEVKSDISKLKLWSKTFEGAYKKAEKEQSYLGYFFQFVLKILLGLTLPFDDSSANLSYHFEMKRSPVGHFDVLYLDKDLRITRGNRGTVVVVERCKNLEHPEH